MSPRHGDSVSTLLPSSLIKQALTERARERLFWAVGVTPEEVVLAEKDALLWISPLALRFPQLLIKTRRGELVITYKRREFSRKCDEILKDEKKINSR